MTQHVPAFVTDDEGELALYTLYNLLYSTRAKFQPPLPALRSHLDEALNYLATKEPERAALVRHCLQIAGVMAGEAAALLNDGIDWPTIETLFSPSEEAFRDTPQSWLAVARAEVTRTRNAAVSNAAPAPTQERLPPSPTKAALRRHGRTLRDERAAEERRFYAIARSHGLSTRPEAGDAIRSALSDLFETPIHSRRELTAHQWSKAASALQTEDLHWTHTPATPRPKAIRNGKAAALHL